MENENNSVEKILSLSMDKLKNVADVDAVIGKPIITNKTTIIPITKVSVGYVSGGGEYVQDKKLNPLISGANSGGYSITPIGFLIVDEKGSTKLLNIDGKNALTKMFDVVPEILSAIKCKNGGTKK